MPKKSDKFSGMKDMFQQEIERRTEKFRSETEKLDLEIKLIDSNSQNYDSGLTDIEDRREILTLNREKRSLEEQHKRDIESLTIQTIQKSK